MTTPSTTTPYPGAVIAPGASIHETCRINRGALIGAEAILAPEVVIGKNVMIEGKVIIQRAVHIAENSALLGPVSIGEQALIGPGVIIGLVNAETDSRDTHIMEGCRVGRAVQILAGLHLGRHARIRAGSLVTGDVPHYGLAGQNPAVLERYACPKCGGRLVEIRAVFGAIDTYCEDCGAGEYRFPRLFWTDAFNRVLLPGYAFGELDPNPYADPIWDDDREIGSV